MTTSIDLARKHLNDLLDENPDNLSGKYVAKIALIDLDHIEVSQAAAESQNAAKNKGKTKASKDSITIDRRVLHSRIAAGISTSKTGWPNRVCGGCREGGCANCKTEAAKMADDIIASILGEE